MSNYPEIPEDLWGQLVANGVTSVEEAWGTDHVPVVVINNDKGYVILGTEIINGTTNELFGLIDTGNGKPTLGTVDLNDLFSEEMGYGMRVGPCGGETRISEFAKMATEDGKIELS